MNATDSKNCLGLIVRTGPWRGRSNRDQLDVALMAAAMEWDLVVYFQSEGLLHLLLEQNGRVADLPPGHKAWASISDMTSARFFADKNALNHFAARDSRWVCDIEPLSPEEIISLEDNINQWWVL